MTCGIYKISLADGRCYVGSSVHIERRLAKHKWMLNSNVHHSSYLQNAWNKHGADAFSFDLIMECEESLLIEHEQRFINELDACFNLAPVAGSVLGIKRSQETIEKMSRVPRTPEWRANLSASLKGHVVSAETGARISASNLGRRAWNKGIPPSEETRAKLRVANLGKPATDETKARMSESHRKNWQSSEYREHVTRSQKGIPKSAEHKAKLSESLRGHPVSQETIDKILATKRRNGTIK